MIRFYSILLYVFVFTLFSNCRGVRAIGLSGEAIQRVTKFWKIDSLETDTSFTVLSESAWFNDGIGITQIQAMISNYSDSVNFVVTTPVIGYRYFNLKKSLIYEYNSFSDTATVIKKYRYTDTSKYAGGWNFANKTTTPLKSFELLKDSVIDGISTRRCKVAYASFNNINFEGLALARCDKKGTIFNLDTSMSRKIQCPITSLRRFVSKYHGGIDIEVKFLPDVLPDSVVKVFKAWNINESKFPID